VKATNCSTPGVEEELLEDSGGGGGVLLCVRLQSPPVGSL
jgi:hypothetical protein